MQFGPNKVSIRLNFELDVAMAIMKINSKWGKQIECEQKPDVYLNSVIHFFCI